MRLHPLSYPEICGRVISVRQFDAEFTSQSYACRGGMLNRAVMNERELVGCGIYQPLAVGAYQ